MPCTFRIITPIGHQGEVWPIGSGYGSRIDPIDGGPSWHSGIDIPAPEFTPVRAAADGTVLKSYFSPSGGNTIWLNHGGGIQTRYMHLSTYLYEPGAFVKGGMQIGSVGKTGQRVTGPHLHFELRQNDASIDPTDCYLESTNVYENPYTVPEGTETIDYAAPPPASGNGLNWLPWAIGGATLLGLFALIATKDKNTRKPGRR